MASPRPILRIIVLGNLFAFQNIPSADTYICILHIYWISQFLCLEISKLILCQHRLLVTERKYFGQRLTTSSMMTSATISTKMAFFVPHSSIYRHRNVRERELNYKLNGRPFRMHKLARWCWWRRGRKSVSVLGKPQVLCIALDETIYDTTLPSSHIHTLHKSAYFRSASAFGMRQWAFWVPVYR